MMVMIMMILFMLVIQASQNPFQ